MQEEIPNEVEKYFGKKEITRSVIKNFLIDTYNIVKLNQETGYKLNQRELGEMVGKSKMSISRSFQQTEFITDIFGEKEIEKIEFQKERNSMVTSLEQGKAMAERYRDGTLKRGVQGRFQEFKQM